MMRPKQEITGEEWAEIFDRIGNYTLNNTKPRVDAAWLWLCTHMDISKTSFQWRLREKRLDIAPGSVPAPAHRPLRRRCARRRASIRT